MTDKDWRIGQRSIFLHGLIIPVWIGIHDEERLASQRIKIDVTVGITPEELPDTDDIHSVVDYDYLRTGITEIAVSRHFDLQETLCAEILKLCFTKSSVISATVRTAKLDVYPNSDEVGISASASRVAVSSASS